MNISSVIVIPHPAQVAAVRERLGEVAGIEIHGQSPEGKLVVTIEAADEGELSRRYEFIGQLDGVLSASMVFHQSEPEPDSKIYVEA